MDRQFSENLWTFERLHLLELNHGYPVILSDVFLVVNYYRNTLWFFAPLAAEIGFDFEG